MKFFTKNKCASKFQEILPLPFPPLKKSISQKIVDLFLKTKEFATKYILYIFQVESLWNFARKKKKLST
jgi:hypothetical protein